MWSENERGKGRRAHKEYRRRKEGEEEVGGRGYHHRWPGSDLV